jgi:hypothetical protein
MPKDRQLNIAGAVSNLSGALNAWKNLCRDSVCPMANGADQKDRRGPQRQAQQQDACKPDRNASANRPRFHILY